jgi:hypothetical protein
MIIAALLMMQATPLVEGAPCRVLRGGIADGMCIGTVEPDEGDFVLAPLLPAAESGPPLPADVAKVLDRLLRAQGRGALDLPRNQLVEGATTRFCTDWTEECMKSKPLTAWPLGPYYTPNRPYLLPDGQIRIEWMLGVKLDYLSLIRFEGIKIKSLDTTPATIPLRKPPKSR